MHRNSDHSQGTTLLKVLASMLSCITQKAFMSRTFRLGTRYINRYINRCINRFNSP